jgi:dimethylaniline monooxygenase (N-oxide forming)
VDGYRHHVVLRRVLDDGSLAEGQDDIHLTCQRVVITTGLHVLPNIPVIPGLNDGTETIKSPAWIHSSEYKSRDQLRDKEVLVLGAGETGMDVAYESVLAPARKVWMGVRSGFLSFPKVLNNFRVLGSTFEGALPIDGLITNLFETAYVHPWVSASHLRWFVSDFVIRRVLWVLTGTQAGCNQWAGELPPERQGRAYVFLNKSAKAMQFINRPYASLSPLHRLFAHYQDPPLPEGVDDPTIHVVPFPSEFDHTGKAIFPPPPAHRSKETAWKESCRPDLVVLCTGYRQEFGWLGEGYPRGPDECNVRGVCSDKDLSVAFIGFLRPGVGEYRSTLCSWSCRAFVSVSRYPPSPSLSLSYLSSHVFAAVCRLIRFGRITYHAPCTTDLADTYTPQAPSPQWPKCRSSSSSSSRPGRSPSQPRRRTITSSMPKDLAYSTAWTTRPTRPRSRGTWARRLG